MWAWEAQDDMEAADREGLQRVELSAIDPHETYLEIWCDGCSKPATWKGPTDVDVAPVPARLSKIR